MASACVNNNVGVVSQEFPTYGCFNPRASFSREDAAKSEIQKKQIPPPPEEILADSAGGGDGDFEFRLEDPVGMLPADELFSDGKLATKEIAGKCRRLEAPRCSSSSRWRELLGLKRFSRSSSSSISSSSSSIKQFLNRSSRSSSGSSTSDTSSLLSLPLLKDSDCESSLSISSSRMSLSSSSSSGHEIEDLPRLSLDAERHNITANPFAPARSLNPRMRLLVKQPNNQTGTRVGRSTMRSCSQIISRGVSVDSPRLNSSGKIVFQSLERSSSSPSSFNGGTSGYRHRGMERSYSSNVRVTPVLNFGQFFSSSSQHSRTGNGSKNHAGGGINRGRNSTDRN